MVVVTNEDWERTRDLRSSRTASLQTRSTSRINFPFGGENLRIPFRHTSHFKDPLARGSLKKWVDLVWREFAIWSIVDDDQRSNELTFRRLHPKLSHPLSDLLEVCVRDPHGIGHELVAWRIGQRAVTARRRGTRGGCLASGHLNCSQDNTHG